jgi:hypothetical protein
MMNKMRRGNGAAFKVKVALEAIKGKRLLPSFSPELLKSLPLLSRI